MAHGNSRGVALIEVLAAIAILAVAGLSLIELVISGTRALAETRAREAEAADQDRLLTAYALLTREELNQRLGVHDIGPYAVGIQRPEPSLYRISIGRLGEPRVEDLVTVVFRRVPVDGR